MTKKIYRSAQGKVVDMGALLLQNENVRAVGNMGVNARGDIVDSSNRVIDQKNRQVQRQYRRQSTNVTRHDRSAELQADPIPTQQQIATAEDSFSDLPDDNDVVVDKAQFSETTNTVQGGLAAAIARSRSVKQELETPLNTKPTTLRKI